MTDECDAIIIFADDFGDNNCTFHCELEEGHSGVHKESGAMGKWRYTLSWKEHE